MYRYKEVNKIFDSEANFEFVGEAKSSCNYDEITVLPALKRYCLHGSSVWMNPFLVLHLHFSCYTNSSK